MIHVRCKPCGTYELGCRLTIEEVPMTEKKRQERLEKNLLRVIEAVVTRAERLEDALLRIIDAVERAKALLEGRTILEMEPEAPPRRQD